MIPLDEYEFLRCEMSFAMKLVNNGLSELGKIIQPDTGLLGYSIMNLANGFERLFKIILILSKVEFENKLVSEINFKKYGHNLQKIIDEIKLIDVNIIDFDTMEKEPYASILNIFTDFGSGLRYYNFDSLKGSQTISPFRKWKEQVQEFILASHYLLPEDKKSMFKSLDKKLTNVFIRFIDYDNSIIDTPFKSMLIRDQYEIISKYVKYYIIIIIQTIRKCLKKSKLKASYQLLEFFNLYATPALELIELEEYYY